MAKNSLMLDKIKPFVRRTARGLVVAVFPHSSHPASRSRKRDSEWENRRLVAAAKQKDLDIVRSHLGDWLQGSNELTYEAWIKALHPENAIGGSIDHRFYVEESEHRQIWNDAARAESLCIVESRSAT